jgi:uncharacterized membrane protein
MDAIIQRIQELSVAQCASMLTGAVIGLISGAIFSVILKRVAKDQPLEAVKKLRALMFWVLGGGIGDYVVFDAILQANAIYYYMVGVAVSFIPFAALILLLSLFLNW